MCTQLQISRRAHQLIINNIQIKCTVIKEKDKRGGRIFISQAHHHCRISQGSELKLTKGSFGSKIVLPWMKDY